MSDEEVIVTINIITLLILYININTRNRTVVQ